MMVYYYLLIINLRMKLTIILLLNKKSCKLDYHIHWGLFFFKVNLKDIPY